MSRALATTPLPERSPLPIGLDAGRLPSHVAVIMDGNGRWANQRGLPRVMGHRAGVEALKRTLRLCSDWGIEALTCYAFSTENWSRPGEEVAFLMALFERVLARELQGLMKERVRIRFLGELDQLPHGLQSLIADATERTAANDGIRFNVCTNYGGRRELVQAARRLAQRPQQPRLQAALTGASGVSGAVVVSCCRASSCQRRQAAGEAR